MKFEGKQISIPVKGIMRAGTDFVSPDGAMNEVIGMEYKHSSWIPYLPKKEEKTSDIAGSSSATSTTANIIKSYVHKLSDNTQNTIYLTSSRDLFYVDSTQTPAQVVLASNVKDVTFVGNTICIATDSGLKHYIWQSDKYELHDWRNNAKIQFRVTAGCAKEVTGDKIVGMSYATKISGEFLDSGDEVPLNEDTNKESVIGGTIAVNGAARDIGGLTGYFLATAAYRLKNGEIVQASAPVLLGRPCQKFGSESGGYYESKIGGGTQFSYTDSQTPENIKLVKGKDASTGETNRYAILVPPSYYDVNDADHDDSTKMYKLGEQRITLKEGTLSSPTPFCYNKNGIVAAVWSDGNHGTLDAETSNYNWNIPFSYVPNLMCTRIRMRTYSGTESGLRNEYIFNSFSATNKLQYLISDLQVYDNDMVDSLCIFLSQQISPYKLSDNPQDFDEVFYKLPSESIELETYSMLGGGVYVESYVPRYRKEEDIIKDIKDIKSFYLVKEIPFSELEEGETWIDVDLEGKLGDNLLTREQLPLTAFDYTNTIPNHIEAYNYRSHIYDYVQQMFKGYNLPDMFYYGGDRQWPAVVLEHEFSEGGTDYTKTYLWEIKVDVRDEMGDFTVVAYETTDLNTINQTLSPFLCYPFENAIRMTINAYAYDSRDVSLHSPLYSRVYTKTVELTNNTNLGISFYVDPALKPVELQLDYSEIVS